ncbi:MAG: DUF971 domain-containing protein [Chloroflexi bacterium]|nr:DUF971 domain-containing protein [Chloroflexota bacterium]
MAPDDYAEGLAPVDITDAALEGTLYIAWPDGHVGVYPWGFLRGVCPCALCKGSHRAVDSARAETCRGYTDGG